MKPIDIKPGDQVTRSLCGIPIILPVESVTKEIIYCHGGWTFDRQTGAELDEVVEWRPGGTGARLTHCNGKKLKGNTMKPTDIMPGDQVTRSLCGIPMELTVGSITKGIIYCHGGWIFDRQTGFEVDEELGWRPWSSFSARQKRKISNGARLTHCNEKELKQ